MDHDETAGKKLPKKALPTQTFLLEVLFVGLEDTFTLTGNTGNKNISMQKLGGGLPSLKHPKTNSSPLKINGWKMKIPFDMACFRGRTVSFREGDSDHP